MAEPDAIEAEQKKIEAKYNPIMMRVYQEAGGAGGMPGGMPPGGFPGGAGGAPPQSSADDLD